MKKLQRIFRKVELFIFDQTYSPLVKVLEFLVVSGCPYCSAIRAIIFGYGIGRLDYLGFMLVIIAFLLNHIEKSINDE